jgi:hypothetical protein
MFAGVSYEIALSEAVKAAGTQVISGRGMTREEVRRAASGLGIPIRVALYTTARDYGLVTLLPRRGRGPAHLALQWKGLIFDPGGSVWEPKQYLKQMDLRPVELLVPEARPA